MIRRLAATLAAVALLLALAAPVLAGGWADIVADAQTVEPPVEGKPLVVGFRVLQHGETPAPWETATVHFTNTSTGKTMDVVATNDRADGHFTATATLPEAGYWSWQVTLKDLVSDHMPVTFAVYTAGGKLPTYDPATTATAIAQAKKDVTAELSDAVLRARSRGWTACSSPSRPGPTVCSPRRTRSSPSETSSRRAWPRPREPVGCRSSPSSRWPILAGATAGFAMSWLAGRPEPEGRGQPSSARSRPGVTCSWRRRPNRATRSGAGAASTHRRRSASPSL